jgi:glycerate kinase
MVKVIAAFDKFRGTATATELCSAVCAALAADERTASWECLQIPMADGGDGLLDALGGANRSTVVTGPLGDPVEAGWILRRRWPTARDITAVIEMAEASGLHLLSDDRDAMAASTTGVGELIDAALAAGATRLVIGLGGSATTDGGFGALRAITAPQRLRGIEISVACDVDTAFVDAARIFGPQKGASPTEVELLTRRLERLVQVYRDQYGVDVSELRGAGAAGGLAGGLAALGATLMRGFDLVSAETGLEDHLGDADVIITGEGHLDAQSFEGKVVGGVVDAAHHSGAAVWIITGDADSEPLRERAPTARTVSLVELCGEARAYTDTLSCITEATTHLVDQHLTG